MMRPERERLLFTIIVAFCAFTRLWDLGARGIMHDESLFVYYTHDHLYKQLTYTYLPILHGPAMLWLQALVFHVFGASDYTMRLSAALLGIAGLWWIRALRPWLGPVGVLVACAFYTLSPTLMFYQRFFRNDDLFIFTNLWIVASALHWWRGRHPGWLASFVVAMAILFCCMESCLFLYFSLATFLALLVVHDLSAWVLDDRRLAVDAARHAPPPVWATALLLFGGFTLFLTRVIEGISYEQSVVDAIGRNFALKDVRSLSLALGIVPPVESAGALGQPWFWRVFYALLAAGSVAAGVLLRLSVMRSWGEAALVSRLWSRLRTDWMWLVGALGFSFALYLMFFTTFFKFPKGPFEIYHETLEYWMGQNAQHRIHGPFHMHVLNMAIYETGPLLFALSATVATFVAMKWSRTRATALLLAAAAMAAFHLLVFRGLETPMPYMLCAGAVIALAGFSLIPARVKRQQNAAPAVSPKYLRSLLTSRFSTGLPAYVISCGAAVVFLILMLRIESPKLVLLATGPLLSSIAMVAVARRVGKANGLAGLVFFAFICTVLAGFSIILASLGAPVLASVFALLTVVFACLAGRVIGGDIVFRTVTPVVGPGTMTVFVFGSLAYFTSAGWTGFLNSVARRGGRELARSGKQLVEDTLSLTSGVHLFLIAFLILVGTVVAWRFIDRGERFRGLLVWWLVTMIGACSYAREKVPWVGIYITLPLVLLAGAYAQDIADRWLSREGRRARRVACSVLLGAGLLWSAKGAFNLCFVNYDDVRERMVFAHPPREVREHVDIVRRALASASLRTELGGGSLAAWHATYNTPNRTRKVRILVQNDTLHWPMRWYLRDTDWDQNYSGSGLAAAGYDFMFLNADAREANPGLEENYVLRDGRVHMHWVARPLDADALAGAWRLAMPEHLQDRAKAAKTREEWRKAWRYMLYREIPIDNGATGLSWVGYVFAERKPESIARDVPSTSAGSEEHE